MIPGIKTELISKASKIVSNATGFPVQLTKQLLAKMLLHTSQEFIKMEC
jgi:hypothetical protein